MEHFEYVIKPQPGDARILRLKIKLFVLYFAVLGVPVGLSVLFVPSPLWPVMAVVTASVVFCAVAFTWHKTRPEIEYSVDDGVLTVANIYAGRIRKTILETPLRDAALIAPMSEEFEERLREFDAETSYVGVFDNSQASYFMLFTDEDERRAVLYLYADADIAKRYKRLNPRTVIGK